MPSKAKFTKEEIVKAALNIVRTDGFEALTSRALGIQLGSSARPIFTVFKNISLFRFPPGIGHYRIQKYG